MVKPPLILVKMFRDMHRSLSAYLISCCIVTIGVVGYSVLSITSDNLDYSRQLFYKQSNFAHGFADVVMAPKAVERQIARIPGITKAQGRLVTSARVTELSGGEAELQIYSFSRDGLCVPLQQSGAQPGRGELLLSQDFMNAHGLDVGDQITLSINGRRTRLRIAGTALAPETVYMVKNMADMMPDPEKYDAGYITYDSLSDIMGVEQQVNSLVYLMDDSREFDDIKDELEKVLAPYGCLTVYDREDQLSHSIIDAEIKQIKTMSSSVPLLFLGIAGIIISITLSRLVEQQRVQIGTLMALGMKPQKLLWHYCGYGGVVGLVGGILGGVAGIFAADGMSSFYRVYFKIPSYGLYASPWYFVGGIVVPVIFCGAIAWHSARGLTGLSPAVALRPESPGKAGVTPIESIPGLLAMLTVSGRIAVRSMYRSWRKTLLSLLGVACAYMISAALLSMFSMLDVFVFDYLEDNQRQDLIVSFQQPVAEKDAMRAVRSNYIECVEPAAEFAVTLISPKHRLDCTILGLETNGKLYKLYDKSGARIPIREDGIVISQHMSTILGVSVGDTLEVKISYPVERTASLSVTGIAEQYLGSNAYTSRSQLARIGDLGDVVTSLYIKINAEGESLLRRQLEDINNVSSVVSRSEKMDTYRTMMGSFNAIYFAMVMMGVVIGFAVVYTGSLISFEELKREVSTLLALGMGSKQAVEVISVGQWLISVAGIIMGIPMTVAVSKIISHSMSTELYSIPDFISTSSLLLAGGLTMLSVWLGTTVIHRRIKSIDLVELLRERE